MPRIAVLTKEKIIEAAFSISRDQGSDSVTIRSIATALGTSTSAIYTQYPKIETIFKDLSDFVKRLLLSSTSQKRTPDPFLNIGLGILAFALENKTIFSNYFLSQEEPFFNFTCREEDFIRQMRQNQFLAVLGDERLKSLLEDMWIYTFGLATMICTGLEIQTELDYYKGKLEQTGNKLINYHLYSSGKYEEYIQKIKEQISKHINIEEIFKV